jgi:TPP-dependent pyruvate/acetoin dehydrogenase alpha subunit
MGKNKLWTEQYQKDVEEQSKDAVAAAVKTAEAILPPEPRDMFTYTYESLTPRQKKQIGDL